LKTIGVDTGGTFTDLVAVEDGEVRVEKLPSTPADPSRAVLEGIARLGGAGRRDEVVHGTTVALNALLTRGVARTALVTNEGFRDLVEIGRQARPELYAEHPRKAPPLVERALRFELPQRSWPGADGALEHARRPTRAELDALRARLARARPESIAICLLHAYADPSIEREVADALAPLGVPITCSAELLREYREFERFSTACANAALAPLVADYLENLAAALPGARLSILQSSGGALSADRAAAEPARVLLSGPAGGVVGAARAALEAGLERLVTLDMGGTSTDVAFHEAGSRLEDAVSSAEVDGLPIGLPSLDIHTIGCGGGSIVSLDEGGVLHVGPRSAGADPGPACHGRGGPLTVTDAHVLLGHLAPGRFLAGRFELDEDAVARGFEALGRRLGVRPHRAALAVLEVARAAMRRAVGVMTMQRGHDPERLPLVAFGGAGGLQAAALAGGLGLPGALVPSLPGCLSARGMASADALADRSVTLLAPLSAWSARARRAEARALAADAVAELREAGHPRRSIETEFRLDLRYRGQAYELGVPESFDAGVLRAFAERHLALYGWTLDDGEVELVTLRARAAVRRPLELGRRPRRRALAAAAILGRRKVNLDGVSDAPVVDRERLAPGTVLEGPALVEEFTGTTLVPPGWRAEVTRGGHLWLTTVAG
jgi:N-methylhydantoinase A